MIHDKKYTNHDKFHTEDLCYMYNLLQYIDEGMAIFTKTCDYKQQNKQHLAKMDLGGQHFRLVLDESRRHTS